MEDEWFEEQISKYQRMEPEDLSIEDISNLWKIMEYVRKHSGNNNLPWDNIDRVRRLENEYFSDLDSNFDSTNIISASDELTHKQAAKLLEDSIKFTEYHGLSEEIADGLAMIYRRKIKG